MAPIYFAKFPSLLLSLLEWTLLPLYLSFVICVIFAILPLLSFLATWNEESLNFSFLLLAFTFSNET